MKHIIEHDGIKIKAVERRSGDRGYHSKTRVYGAIDTLSPELLAEVDKWCKVPVTESLKSENPDEAERIMRGYTRAKRAAVADTRKKLNVLLCVAAGELQNASPVAYFSVKAGCSCTCSPGFVLETCVKVAGTPVDLWIVK